MGRLAVRFLPVLGLALLLLAWPASSLYAHGFGERYDLPAPLGFYVAGSGAAVALSFVIIGLFVRGAPGLRDYPRLNLLRWVRHGLVGLAWAAFAFLARVLAVAVFALVLAAGLFGDEAPTKNLAPTVVWVLWWVGLAYASALVGDVWALVNPWRTLFEWAEAVLRRLRPGVELSLRRPYPAEWGAWPGVLLFAGFAWVELVYADAAVPVRIAQMALVYSAITWAGMFVFGKEVWLRKRGGLPPWPSGSSRALRRRRYGSPTRRCALRVPSTAPTGTADASAAGTASAGRPGGSGRCACAPSPRVC